MDAPKTTVVVARVAPPSVCRMSTIDLNAPAHMHRHSLRLTCTLQVISVMKAHVGICALGSQTHATLTLCHNEFSTSQCLHFLFQSCCIFLMQDPLYNGMATQDACLRSTHTSLSRKQRCDAQQPSCLHAKTSGWISVYKQICRNQELKDC